MMVSLEVGEEARTSTRADQAIQDRGLEAETQFDEMTKMESGDEEVPM